MQDIDWTHRVATQVVSQQRTGTFKIIELHIPTALSNEAKDDFKNVSLVDGSVCGNVEAFHNIYKYESCPKCRCKVDDSMHRCGTCEAILKERVQTFKYELCLNLGNDEIFDIIGFSPSVTNVIELPLPTVNDIEEQLNAIFEQKLVEVEFTINKKNMEKIVHKITMKN